MSIRAIAKILNVSPTTVSLALKGSSRVSKKTIQKVEKAAKEVGYTPNARISELMNQVRSSRSPGFHSAIAAISLFPHKEPWKEEQYWHLKEVYQGASERAAKHGYKLELMWLNEPSMTPKRFRQILEARGIRGLYCLGSLDPDAALPQELGNFAIVGHGTSVSSNLHRVRSYFSNDCLLTLNKLVERNYKKIGLVIKTSGDRRTNYSYTSTFVGYSERALTREHLPILRMEAWDEDALIKWMNRHNPDALIIHHDPEFVQSVKNSLQKREIEIPRDLGITVLDKPPNASYTGIIQDTYLMGAQAIEMLIGRILLGESELPSQPKVQLVDGFWNEGETIRKPAP